MPAVHASPTVSRALFWYLMVGGAKTAASLGGYAILLRFGCHPQVALVLTHILVTVAGYRSHARLAFGVSGWSGLWWYVAVTALVYAVNAGLLAVLLTWGCPPLLAQVLCQVVTIPLGFICLRLALRPRSRAGPEWHRPGVSRSRVGLGQPESDA
jgi:GtrA-like protein